MTGVFLRSDGCQPGGWCLYLLNWFIGPVSVSVATLHKLPPKLSKLGPNYPGNVTVEDTIEPTDLQPTHVDTIYIYSNRHVRLGSRHKSDKMEY